MLKTIREKYIPNKVVILSAEQKVQMEIISPILREYTPQDNKTSSLHLRKLQMQHAHHHPGRPSRRN